jgi:hypothetical protein
MTYDAATSHWLWYQNGELMEGFDSPEGGPNTINDLNNWLGRSNFLGDANMDGIFNEFRIYDYALNEEHVRGNFNAGPDTVNVVPEPSGAALLAFGTLALGSLRRRRTAD